MFNTVSDMFTKGNIASLNKAMLHSSYWAQSGAKLYTPTQQNQCWLSWLANTGMLSFELIEQVEQTNRSLVMANALVDIEGHSSNSDHLASFLIGFDIEHNGSNIKSISLNVDPARLCQVLKQEPATLQKWWPKKDPLVLSDLDHQIHANTVHASPSLVLALDKDVSEETLKCLNKWWCIHQQGLLGDIFDCYTTDAVIEQSEYAVQLSLLDYFKHVAQASVSCERAYCQLVDITVSKNTAFVNWRIEADGQHGRTRQSFFSLLKMAKDKVSHQYTILS
ncbi:MAG: hypothetical protein ACJAVV_000721 [Alphaproteobacteria bacterium]|jgi:hypothetical protein